MSHFLHSKRRTEPPREGAVQPDRGRGADDLDNAEFRALMERLASDELLNSPYALAFHHSPIPFMITRRSDGRMLRINKPMAELFGRREVELIGQTTFDVGMWQTVADREEFFAPLHENGFLYDRPLEYIRPSGEKRLVRLWLTIVHVEGCDCVVGCIYDVTKLVRTSEELETSHRQFRRLSEIVPVGIFRTDVYGHCDFVNEECSRLTGRSTEELLGTRWHDVLHPDDRARVLDYFRGTMAIGDSVSFEVRIELPGSGERCLLCRLSAAPAGEGQFSIIGSLTDITDRRRSERRLERQRDELESLVEQRNRELAASETRLRSLIENAPDQIFTLDREHVVTYINYTVPGLTREQVVGQNILEFVAPEYQERARQAIEKVFQTGQTVHTEPLLGLGAHGAAVWYSANIAPIKYGDVVTAALVVCRDTTMEREAEETLRERDLEASLSARNLIAGSMGTVLIHELAHPLWSLNSFVEGAIHRIDADECTIDDAREVLKDIGRSTERAVGILDRLRKIQKRASIRDSEVVVVKPSLLTCVEAFQRTARKHGFRLVVDVEPADVQARGDEFLIGQVVSNLIQNAIDALCEAGTEPGVIEVRARREDADVVFCVVDNGPGIAPEDFSKVQRPWFTTKQDGLGIGLTICRQIVEQMGGKLWFEPNTGPGLSARFRLPNAETVSLPGRER